jgi:hypothetical protein
MKRALGLVAAVLALVGAVVLLLLALDVRRYEHRIAADDAALAANPARPNLWRPTQVIPFGAARGMLGISDDLAYRNALRLFLLGHPWLFSDLIPLRVIAYRNAAQTRLSDLVQRDTDPARRSRELNLAGVLSSVSVTPLDPAHRLNGLVRAALSYRDAILTDERDDAAKFNLEVALRMLGFQPAVGNTLRGLGGAATQNTEFHVGY